MVNGAFTYDFGELEPPRIRNEPKTAEPRARPLFEQIWNPANHVKSLSLLAGYATGEAYSIYAVFEVNGLAPVSAYMTEHTPYLRAVSGKYREVFDLGGLLPHCRGLVRRIRFGMVRGAENCFRTCRFGTSAGCPEYVGNQTVTFLSIIVRREASRSGR